MFFCIYNKKYCSNKLIYVLTNKAKLTKLLMWIKASFFQSKLNIYND